MSKLLKQRITFFPPKETSQESSLLTVTSESLSFTSLEPRSFCHFFSISSILLDYIFLLFTCSLNKLTFQTLLHLDIKIISLNFLTVAHLGLRTIKDTK